LKIRVLLLSLMFLLGSSLFNNLSAQSPAKVTSKTYYSNKVIVLMYHHIDAEESGATISPARFGTHMKLLHERGYNVISSEQFYRFMLHKEQVPNNAVVITFDDGYDSYRKYAVPIMNKYKMVGTHFIIGQSSDLHNVATPHLTWDTMRKLKEEGHSFYSHTYNLHYYANLNKAGTKTGPLLTNRIYLKDAGRIETAIEYKKRITDDLSLMEQRLQEELDNEYGMLAFPYGAYNDTVKQILKQLDVNLFFTIKPGINKAGSDEVYRLNAGTPKMTANKFVEMLSKYHE
jgi:peptidoglycan/xylan/chitin deacetylase (PgdA/CDA1 family)